MTLFLFDIDDTLLKSPDRILVKRGGEVIDRLDTEQFAKRKIGPDEEYDFTEFNDPEHIKNLKNAPPAFGLAILNQILETHDENDIDVGLLTARSKEEEMFQAINIFLEDHFLPKVSRDLVFAINDPKHNARGNSIPERKLNVIQYLSDFYDEIYFIDDDEKNLNIVKDWAAKNSLADRIITVNASIEE